MKFSAKMRHAKLYISYLECFSVRWVFFFLEFFLVFQVWLLEYVFDWITRCLKRNLNSIHVFLWFQIFDKANSFFLRIFLGIFWKFKKFDKKKVTEISRKTKVRWVRHLVYFHIIGTRRNRRLATFFFPEFFGIFPLNSEIRKKVISNERWRKKKRARHCKFQLDKLKHVRSIANFRFLKFQKFTTEKVFDLLQERKVVHALFPV